MKNKKVGCYWYVIIIAQNCEENMSKVFLFFKELKRLYVMDTGMVAPGKESTNDWIHPEQVEWFSQTAEIIKSIKTVFYLSIFRCLNI